MVLFLWGFCCCYLVWLFGGGFVCVLYYYCCCYYDCDDDDDVFTLCEGFLLGSFWGVLLVCCFVFFPLMHNGVCSLCCSFLFSFYLLFIYLFPPVLCCLVADCCAFCFITRSLFKLNCVGGWVWNRVYIQCTLMETGKSSTTAVMENICANLLVYTADTPIYYTFCRNISNYFGPETYK